MSGLQPTDPDWSYLVGDCVHNLRSGLDHLVYQLATLAVARNLTDEEGRTCQFPIFDDAKKFKDRGIANIRLLRVGEQTRITELQPFNAWDASIWGNGKRVNTRANAAWVPSMLSRVQILDNADKHRLVHATWQSASWRAFDLPPEEFLNTTSVIAGRLENGAEIGRWQYTPPRPQLASDMDMDRYFSVGISIDEFPALDALDLLDSLIEAIELVIGLFRPCFGGSVALPVTTL